MTLRGPVWIMRACVLVSLAVAVLVPSPAEPAWLARVSTALLSVGAGVCFAGASAAMDAQRRGAVDSLAATSDRGPVGRLCAARGRHPACTSRRA